MRGLVWMAPMVALLVTPAAAQQLTGDLENLKATIWIDPNGCEHWVMDDGAEGYMTARRNRDGTPVCPGVTEANWPNAAANAPLFEQDVTIWTDPKGCQHWVADHGSVAYMSERLTRDGKPVCPGSQ